MVAPIEWVEACRGAHRLLAALHKRRQRVVGPSGRNARAAAPDPCSPGIPALHVTCGAPRHSALLTYQHRSNMLSIPDCAGATPGSLDRSLRRSLTAAGSVSGSSPTSRQLQRSESSGTTGLTRI